MGASNLHGTGSLEPVLGRIAERATPVRPHSAVAEIAPERTSPSPAETLARLLDLAGTVRVAEALDVLEQQELDSGAQAVDCAAARAAVERLSVRLEERKARLRRELDMLFDRPFRGRLAVPDPAETYARLTEIGVFEDRTDKRLAAAVKAFGPIYRELFERPIAQIRADVRAERHELGTELRALFARGELRGTSLGRRAAALEALDLVITRATAQGIARILKRTEARLDEGFARTLRAAIAALPGEPKAEDIERWFDRGGPMKSILDDTGVVVREWLEHEWRALDGLLHGVSAILDRSSDHDSAASSGPGEQRHDA